MANIFSFPWDIWEEILLYLTHIDIYILTQVDPTLDATEMFECYFRVTKNFYLDLTDLRIDTDLLRNMFKIETITSKVTTLNMSSVYWIAASQLRAWIKKFVNLKQLYIVGTKLQLKDLERIYDSNKECKQIIFRHEKKTKLSNRLDNTNWTPQGLFPRFGAGGGSVDRRLKFNWIQEHIDILLNNFEPFKPENLPLRVLNYIDLEKYDENVDQKTKTARNITIISSYSTLRNNKIYANLAKLSQIEKLDIEIATYATPYSFFKAAQSLPNLKSLSIYNHHYSCPLLTLGANVSELSVITKGAFHVDAFFENVRSENMKRVFLKFKSVKIISVEPLERFMANAHRLDVFVMQCNVPISVVQSVQRMMLKYQRRDKQVLKICTLKDDIFDILPTTHFDIAQAYYE